MSGPAVLTAVRHRRLLTRTLLSIATVAAGCATMLGTALTGVSGNALPASGAALRDVPGGYLALYQSAASSCTGLPWTVLAGVGKVESDHGRNTGTSGAGAQGPMQFLPDTWNSYGTDGNADGRVLVTDPGDAIPTAARLLCAFGVDRDIRAALTSYNCGNPGARCQQATAGYVQRVLGWAASYASPPLDSGQLSTVSAARPAVGSADPARLVHVLRVTLGVATAQLGTPYRWGGEEPGGFDCSGLVQYSYAAGGLPLPRTAQAQYDAGPRLPTSTLRQADRLFPGDLLFFGTGPLAITHVGMYLGSPRGTPTMIVAPHAGTVVRYQQVDLASPRLVGASRPIARYLMPAVTPASSPTAAGR